MIRRWLTLSWFLSVLTFPALLSAATPPGPKIKEVVFDGIRNAKKGEIRDQIKSKKKKPYSEETVKSDVQSILSMGNFENVEVSFDTDTLRVVFHLKEKPYIKRITILGNDEYSDGRIREEMTLKEKGFYDIARIEESKEKITKLYQDKGYRNVKVEAKPTLDEDSGQMILTVIVKEGKKILVGGITMEGPKVYKPKKILGLMKTKKKKVYKDETMREDIGEITKFYKNEGYVQVVVDEPVLTYNEDGTRMFVAMKVTEGPRFRLGTITFTGNQVYATEELAKTFELKQGKIFNDEKMQEGRAGVQELYSDKGYLHSRIDMQLEPEADKEVMNVSIDIVENDQVFLGNVYIDGLNATKDYVIRREVLLKEGDVLAAGKVRRTMEKIYNLGFIDGVEPDLLPTEKRDTMDLAFNVTEGKPGMLSAGMGYSSTDQFTGTISLQHMNLFGKAQRLSLSTDFGYRRNNFDIDWTEPWFLGKPMSLGIGVFNTERKRDYGTQYNAYTERRKGGSVRLAPRVSDNLSLSLGYSYEDVDLAVETDTGAVVDAVNSGYLSPGRKLTSSITGQIVWDSRDYVFDATRGNRQALSAQVAGGPLQGDVHFIKPTMRSSWFFPTFWKFVLSLNANLGFVTSFPPSDDVERYDRFFVGGADSVRGYNYTGEIGPDQGGKLMAVLNAEYKVPLVQEKKKSILQFAVFADIGGAWLSPYDVEYSIGEDKGQFKAGVGFGIRFTTPAFPLRLDWGFGLNREAGRDPNQFYFTIGSMF